MNNLEVIGNYLDDVEITELCRELDSSSYNTEDKDIPLEYNNILCKYDLCFDNVNNIEFEVNKLLKTHYQNEKVIKSAFIKSHFSKSIENILAIEFPIKSSRVDLAKFNGSSYAYEIKTDYDNFSRLQKQLDDYIQIFDFVYVILSKKKYTKNKDYFPNNIGVYSYTIKDSTIKFSKEQNAEKNVDKDMYGLLNLLHIKELKFAFKRCPKDQKKSMQITTILNLYSSKYINSKVKALIKMRYRKRWKEAYYMLEEIPDISLKQLYYKNGSRY